MGRAGQRAARPRPARLRAQAAFLVFRQDAYRLGLERAGRERLDQVSECGACRGLCQAFNAPAYPRTAGGGRAATTAAQGHFPPQDALRAPRRPESSAYRHSRQCPGRNSGFIQALPGNPLPQRVQAGRHAAAHRIQVFPQSLSAGGAVSRYWSDHLASLSPYVAGEQPKVANLLKLNTNEHPYGPSPSVLEAIKAAATDRLRLYPDNECTGLRETIAELHGVQANQVFAGNGSDEVLAHIFNALFRRAGRPLLMPDIYYSFYRTYCKLY